MDEINAAKLLNQVVEFYCHSFVEDNRGNEFLRKSGITDNSVISQFKIGFCNGTIYKTIPESGEITDTLKQIGILTNDGQEYFKDSLVFPVFNQQESVSVVYGKSILDNSIKVVNTREGLSLFNWQITPFGTDHIFSNG